MNTIKVVDSHTGGEPTRLVMEGVPDLGGGTVAEQAQVFLKQFDQIRTSIICEPRGSDVLVGAMLVPSLRPECLSGVIFFNNAGLLGMCGHGTIGVIASLAHLGRIGPGQYQLETTVGNVVATLEENRTVSVRNVPSHRKAKGVSVEVPGFGKVTGDIAWGGNWFFLVEQHPFQLSINQVEALTDFAWKVRIAVNQAGFPEVDHVELFGPPSGPHADSRNFVLCPGKAYDRSPCGTGTSAKLACLIADGKIKVGQTWRQESIIGSVFAGEIEQTEAGWVPTIRGTAFVTGYSSLVFEQGDPFLSGIPSAAIAPPPA